MNKGYSTPKVFIAACAGMSFFGMAMLSMAPILGRLNEMVSGANALPSTMSLGILLGTMVFGPVVDRFGYKSLMVVASVMALAGVRGLAGFQEILPLHISIFCLGFGGGVLNGATNALASDIYDDDRRGGRIALVGSFYCIGALLWTFMNLFTEDFTIPLDIVSAVMGFSIAYFLCISFPAAKPSEAVSFRKSVGLLKYPALLLLALVLFFESGFEGAQGNFSALFMEKGKGLDATAAKLAMTVFTVGMLAGRLPLGKVLSRIGNLGALYVYLGIGLAGVLLLSFASSTPLWAYLSLGLIGFGIAATYPVILNYVGGAFRNQSGTAMSIALFVGLLGQFTCNKLAGVAFDAGAYVFLPIMLSSAVLCMMVIAPLAVKAASKIKNQ